MAVLLLGLFEAGVDFVPVDGVPPGGEVVGPAVLILQVIGVLPHVVAEDRVFALHQRAVLIGSGGDSELAAIPKDPAPAGAELLRRGVVELLLEGFEVAEVLANLRGNLAGGLAATALLHDVPEHGVVDVAAAVVADDGADILGNVVDVSQQVLGSVFAEFGVLLDGAIEVIDVGLVMLVVVEMHGLLVDVRLERGVVIGQWWNFVSQNVSPSLLDACLESLGESLWDSRDASPIILDAEERWRGSRTAFSDQR